MNKRTLELVLSLPRDLKMYNIEGIDGAGKTTQAKNVVSRLVKLGFPAVFATNPSESALGKFLRENLMFLDPWQRISLFVIDMLDVISHQEEGSIIIWDRYTDSTMISNKEIKPKEASLWLKDLPLPRKTFFLDIKPNEILQNRAVSLHDHSSDESWQKLKYKRYKELILKNPSNFHCIDGNIEKNKISQTISEYILEDLRKI